MSSVEIQRPSPYQGLVPYSEADAPFFFGREKETRLIIANLFGSPLTLLYGASGVGKSSVLRAGVAHQLRGRDDLLVVVFNSWQSSPIRDLQQAVADFADLADHDAWRKAVSLLPQDRSASLAEFLRICAAQLNRRLMIILDQFEEYFLYHPQDDEFAAEFPLAVTQSEAPVSFLISIREDFYAKLDRFEGRIPTLYDNYLRIEHLDRNAARVAIEKPVAEYNRQYTTDGKFTIEPKLVEAVLKQVETGRVTLGEAGRGVVEAAKTLAEAEPQIETPFLQLVMTRLWDEECANNSHELQLETLKRLGGAENIVRTHLDAVITRLSEREQAVAANVFHYLVTPSGTKIAYSAPDLAESCGLYEAEVVRVLEKLSHGNVRILRSVDPLPTQPTVARYEIFHDVLAPAILAWRTAYVQAQERADAERRADELQRRNDEQARAARRLRWLAAALAFMFLLSLVATAFAAKYARESRNLRAEGQQLKETGQREREAGEASRAQADYLAKRATDLQQRGDAALALAAKERITTQEQIRIAELRKTEAKRASKRADDENHLAETAQAKAIAEGNRAEKQARDNRITYSNLLAAQSKVSSDTNPQRSLLLAVEALNKTQAGDPYVQGAEEALRQALAQSGGHPLGSHKGVVKYVAMSPNNRWLVTTSETIDPAITTPLLRTYLWEIDATGRTITSINLTDIDAPIAFSQDNNWLVAFGRNPEGGTNPPFVRLWNLTAAHPAASTLDLPADKGVITRVLFSPNSRWLAVGDVFGKVCLWDLKGAKFPGKSFVLQSPGAPIITIEISPDSHWLVTDSGRPDRCQRDTARLWDLTATDPAARHFDLVGHTMPVTEVAFSPNGQWLVTGSKGCYVYNSCLNNVARLWNLKTIGSSDTSLTSKELRGHDGPISAIAISPDNHWVITGSGCDGHCCTDATARMWDLTTADPAANSKVLPDHDGQISAIAVSSNNHWLVTVTDHTDSRVKLHTVRLWDLTSAVPAALPIVLRDAETSFRSVVFSSDNHWLVTSGSANTPRLWDLTSNYFSDTEGNVIPSGPAIRPRALRAMTA